ncbi:hypothetical protein FB45DRAFT_745969 [Roridomyces roridus]|uniref:PSP proline-rich domain-containing protein n=1 Tax=Roridomyces roridus TaxID=1738132 RepID=A0AAD7FRA8_9AGAR|nr:hypothetical protein FB45DRAFT_745969 [Roridomyces roridus]
MSLRLIPRLTLFSGANCPLCELAKIELNRVRQQRPFQLETIDIHAAGNAAWKKKYVYWIPALHVDGKEVVKGRWDASDDIYRASKQLPSLPFYTDTSPTSYYGNNWQTSGIYIRNVIDPSSADICALGEPPEPIPDAYAAAAPRCFNCSATTHVLSACPNPVDKALVALSRQIYDFEHASQDGTPRSLREVAERIERAGWAGSGGFVPGEVSADLRHALRGDYEWLENMAIWGYPPGWVSAVDPRVRMQARIMRERDPAADEEEEEEEVMKIWGEDGEEEVLISGQWAGEKRDTEAETQNEGELKRWARYPSTHFAWDRLTVYNGVLLSQRQRLRPPPMQPPEPTGPPPPQPPPAASTVASKSIPCTHLSWLLLRASYPTYMAFSAHIGFA